MLFGRVSCLVLAEVKVSFVLGCLSWTLKGAPWLAAGMPGIAQQSLTGTLRPGAHVQRSHGCCLSPMARCL